ncbi:O-linked N-acetylglucosamine transferase, SPINDLY family protein [Caballeronia glebae]|nr:tetratricopeptide repeat protein [Caballeronia glebae]
MQESTAASLEPFDSAMARFREGDREQAENLCLEILDTMPENAPARHLLGAIHLLNGDPVTAESFIRASLSIEADERKEIDLGLTLKAQKRHAEAEAAFRRALLLDPNFALAHYNLARLFDEQGDPAAAEAAYRSAIECAPNVAQYCFDLGRHLAIKGAFPQALEQLNRTVELAPDSAEALNSLGIVLIDMEQPEKAEFIFRRVVELSPNFVLGLTNLGNVLIDTGRTSEAEFYLRRALEVDPNDAAAGYNFAVLLAKVRKIDEAESIARRAIEANPRSAVNHFGLGNILLTKGAGDIAEALNCFRAAIEFDPTYQAAHANLAYALNFSSENGYDVLHECRRFAAQFEAPYASEPVQYENDLSSARRLRVGYVSADFRFHCQAMFMLPLLRNHDHTVVEVYCYSSVTHPDDTTAKLAQFADVWRDVHDLDGHRLAHQIKEDRIDVLIDLTMHMSNARRLVFARRPAPVQIAWLAYPGTTGSSAIGYRLTDPWLDPLQTRYLDDRYSEKSLRLPDTFWCYEPLITGLEVSPPPARSRGHITFGCLNSPGKLTDRIFGLWARVMRKVENSRLLLMLAPGDARTRVITKYAQLGVDQTRITFVDFQPPEQYMRAYGKIDIVLDTFPYNGHTTSLDALWMGVPIVTLTGSTPVSRAGYALLSNLEIPELAADSEEEFVRISVELAMNQARLEELRLNLRPRMARSPLMDGSRFARSVEKSYRDAWTEWCDGAVQAPVVPLT